MSATTYSWLVLALPLAGSLITAAGWRILPGRVGGWVASGAVGASFVCAVAAFFALQSEPEQSRQLVSSLYRYVVSQGAPTVDLGILIDPLSVLMMLVVSGVGFLIHLYSIAYMSSDRGYNRFFSYLNFFIFSMLLLVLAGNFVLLVVGWALVGFASFALISFYYRRRTATVAGTKAFVINVIGDVGMVLAAFLIFQKIGSVDFTTVFSKAGDVFDVNDGTIILICLLLMAGAFAKSAQLPLHTWLPDAMEGPTPVSALIHAATMVTAGVYMIARSHVLFELGATAAQISAVIGTVTLIFAGTVALTQTDIKRIIAYSTISQIGYMILAVSAAAYVAGLFHLVTHAFFKALLFMAAGSVIGAMAGSQSIDKMGGFKKAMPFTYIAFLVGSLALAAIPGFSGYFSKDEILAFIDARGGSWLILYVAGYLGAFLTGLYSFRLLFRVFHGSPCPEAEQLAAGKLHHAEHPSNPATGEPEDTDVGYPGPDHHIAEREQTMSVAMAVLAVLAVIGGVLQIPFVNHSLESFLAPTFADSRFAELRPSDSVTVLGLLLSAAVAISSVGLAAYLYLGRPQTAARLREKFAPLYRFFLNKWYFDELFDYMLVRPFAAVGRFATDKVERVFVDGLFVGGTALLVRSSGTVVRLAQSGYLRRYILLLAAAVVVLTLYLLLQR